MPEGWWIIIRAFGSAVLIPFLPAANKRLAILHAWPIPALIRNLGYLKFRLIIMAALQKIESFITISFTHGWLKGDKQQFNSRRTKYGKHTHTDSEPVKLYIPSSSIYIRNFTKIGNVFILPVNLTDGEKCKICTVAKFFVQYSLYS